AAITFIPHQRLVPAPQLLAQALQGRLTACPVRHHFLLVDAHHVTPTFNLHLFYLQRGRVTRLLTLAVDDTETAAVGQHLFAHFLLTPHPRPQDVRPALLLQVADRVLADHASVGHNTDLTNAEFTPQAVHHRDERRDVRRVARPQLAADRPARAVED